jgi:DNA segregation ATPase FtsK/SpoIIIE, S-DNA-T family
MKVTGNSRFVISPRNQSMAQNTFRKAQQEVKAPKKSLGTFPFMAVLKDKRTRQFAGLSLVFFTFYLSTALISYLFTGSADQSLVEHFWDNDAGETGKKVENWAGTGGAILSYFFIYKWVGISSLLWVPFFLFTGYTWLFSQVWVSPGFYLKRAFLASLWLSTTAGYALQVFKIDSFYDFLSGHWGFQLSLWLSGWMRWGTWLFLVFTGIILTTWLFKLSGLWYVPNLQTGGTEKKTRKQKYSEDATFKQAIEEEQIEDEEVENHKEDETTEGEQTEDEIEIEVIKHRTAGEPALIIENNLEVDQEVEDADFGAGNQLTPEHLVDKFGKYDPTLDLSSYKFPNLDLLKHHSSGEFEINSTEIEANKKRITETLLNYGIGIASIKATIGPTVTLYEIVPDAGVRISKIKNLEDDIALSLAALGIRIIAPIPGKGTIGIEVPNKNRALVSIRSVLGTEKFIKCDFDLPVVLGRTISNEVFVIDLAKMPHLLMAGATGQGKSVGLNVLLTSLIYKKHPSQLKLVLVDPKMVELSLYSKLERHFLAALPDAEEAIITDTKKVVNTLNSLCIEMESRYGLLKAAGCRFLKEYNQKFVERKLNPEQGHRFMPYIVLVIDELADLMMTAGKEVELPIARLAQLARAVGIHLVVATQRPSVNVITGTIKANFPARLSFKVTSKIDSRTILDTGGADQLVSNGDMLLSQGSELIRLQCPFVDTEEINNICDYIGEQRGYEHAYLLPEYEGDESGDSMMDFDASERDPLFNDAARLVVSSQQGSTSLLQRKLKLGYNRAGRLMDQLENFGIVGPFTGTKAREVQYKDMNELEQKLRSLNSD